MKTEILGTAAASLISVNSVELHDLVASSSGCAVMGLLLRILFSPVIQVRLKSIKCLLLLLLQ